MSASLHDLVNQLGGKLVSRAAMKENKLSLSSSSSSSSSSHNLSTIEAFLYVLVDDLLQIVRMLDTLAHTPSIGGVSSSSSSSGELGKIRGKNDLPAPLTALSINHLRIVYTAVEVIWICGLCPLLESSLGTKFDWSDVVHPKSLLLSPDQLESWSNSIPPNSSLLVKGSEQSDNALTMAWSYARCMHIVLRNNAFAAHMLPRNLRRLLVSLLVLSKTVLEQSAMFSNSSFSNSVLATSDSREATADMVPELAYNLLRELCDASGGKPLVVSELRIATRGPSWMKTAASALLTHILLSPPNGLEAVLKAHLDGITDGPESAMLQMRVAKMVTCAPSGMIKEEYLQRLSPQVIELMHFALEIDDKVLQRVCVLIVTRIAYTAPAVCDDCLLRPLAWAVLALDSEPHDNRMGTGSGIVRHRSSGNSVICDAKQVFKSVAVLNALATLCPLQPPLVTALSRSGVGEAATKLCLQMLLQIPSAVCPTGRAAVAAANSSSSRTTPSEQTLRPLALLMDFCFQYWTNMAASSSSLEELARQIECVMLRSPVHCFVCDQQGTVGIYHRALDVDTKARNSPIIDSPQLLLSALANMEDRQSTSEGKDGLSSDDGDDDPGSELRELLALAAKVAKMGVNTTSSAAGEYAATTSSRSSSSSSSSYLSQLLRTLPQQAKVGTDEGDLQDDDAGISGAAVAGQALVDVGSRAQAMAELLLLYEEHQQQPQQQPPQRSKDDVDSDSSSDSKAAVASEVFLRCLRSFLGSQITSADTDSSASPCDYGRAQEQGTMMMQRGLSGLALMTFQSLIPMSILLKNGAKVIEIVAAFLEAHAAGLDRPLADREYEMSPLAGHNDIDASSSNRPLIHVISSTESGSPSSSCISSQEARKEESDGGDLEILSCALSILTALLGLGSGEKRSAREETALRGLLRPLQIIAFKDPDEERARAASDSSLLLLNRFTTSGAVGDEKAVGTHTCSQEQSQSAFAKVVAAAKNDLCSSSDAPMRAMGVHAISFAMKDPATTPLSDDDIELALSTLLSLLIDTDSFVYLHVLSAISTLADLSRMKVFSALLSAFSGGDDDEADIGPGFVSSVRYRALLGESLAVVIRRAGPAAVPLVPGLVAACVKMARTRLSREDALLVDAAVNLNTMRVITVPEKGDEAEGVESSQSLEIEGGGNVDREAAAGAADRAILRQSALSLLAEAVVCAGWSASALSTRLFDVLDIATGVLSMETESSQIAVATRRSASFLLRHLISGLREKLIHMENGGLYLQASYRALKQAAEDRDRIVRFHSMAALGALDEMMREQIFFSEAQLQGKHAPKIGIFR